MSNAAFKWLQLYVSEHNYKWLKFWVTLYIGECYFIWKNFTVYKWAPLCISEYNCTYVSTTAFKWVPNTFASLAEYTLNEMKQKACQYLNFHVTGIKNVEIKNTAESRETQRSKNFLFNQKVATQWKNFLCKSAIKMNFLMFPSVKWAQHESQVL